MIHKGRQLYIDVVVQVAPDARQRMFHRDSQAVQILRRPYAREPEEFGAGDGARAENCLSLSAEFLHPTAAHGANADTAPLLDDQIERRRPCPDREIWPPPRRLQIGVRRAMAKTVFLGRLGEPHAVGDSDRIVRRRRDPLANKGVHDIGASAVRVFKSPHPERSLAPSRRVGWPRPVLHATKIGEHVVPAPSGISGVDPAGVISRQAAAIDHAVDGGGAA